jgi:hypothetical protein
MTNWCLGCHREIPDGDYCGACIPMTEEAEIMLFGTPEEQENYQRKWDSIRAANRLKREAQEERDREMKKRLGLPDDDEIPF